MHRAIIFLFFIVFTHITLAADDKKTETAIQCVDSVSKDQLVGGWYLWEPYQYNKITAGGYTLTGMDIQLVRSIAKKVGVDIKYEQVDWSQHQKDLKNGTRDIAAGATYTSARAEYVYFSVPYRYEENSLFTLNDSNKSLDFRTVSEFLAQIRLQNYILGVTEGFIYADPQINVFINDPSNQDIVRKYANDVEELNALMKGEIDGFISDRIVGAAAILSNKANRVQEVQLNIKTPIHLMFSKKSVPLELVDRFNREIKNFNKTEEYKNIAKTYLYPVLLLQTIDSKWYYFIGVIGTFAYAISGLALSAKDNATLFGTFIFAMLPSVGGGVMRDILINRDEVGIFLTPSYMYYIIIVVLVGFSAIRLLEYYNKNANQYDQVTKFWDNIFIIGDALGQAAFIVTGVCIAIMARIEPIELWGPFFAFLTANGGSILRDLIRSKGSISCFDGTINAETSVIWGLIFSIYLDVNSHNPDPNSIRNVVVIVAVGAFCTRLGAYYMKIPNLKFRNETPDIPESEVVQQQINEEIKQ